MELPNFEEFLKFARSLGAFKNDVRMEVFEFKSWPPTLEQLSTILEKVQNDAINSALDQSLHFLAAYHIWLQSLIAEEEGLDPF